ncbi:hypothetical protein UFOVP257_39 [uncultured Caudovirales phage]|uniref:Uncharacterized protein n=1 Tax=uncultured Caudovirales phage TaxID=2100421 RepID=A0A6J5LEP7_9CAUD|nr:hypothetical protein UFOVP257_39 [uncultured Caudovirales phage]
MKNLHDYIAERNSQYSFRIKVAKQNPNEIMEEIKHALDAYELVNVTKASSLPIQEHREFPKWGACECWQFEATVAYPTTAVQIAQLLRERTGMQAEWVCVYGKQQADQNDYAEAYGKDHTGSLLLDGELKDVAGAQELVGEKRMGSMLKELEDQMPVMKGYTDSKLTSKPAEKTKAAQTTNQLPQGAKSPVGSSQNKITDMRKGKK